ncbi:hypothetical protein HJG60_008720 [Phyllostomus discolor]|uniref:Uncharacterized protein n=1 Tax=Phyllostomus discolor TaxID=89673 RepID=A0A834DL17_9CHIR|nr:hypothetical protein HJG60_008720 [Phyllostomus discolor]
MTFKVGISVAVTHATSGRWEESVTWQARLSTILRATTPRAVRWPQGSPTGRALNAAAVTSPEPEVPRVLTAPAQPAADRRFRWGPLPSLSLAASFQPGVPALSPTLYPQLPGQPVAAGGLGTMWRQA